MSNCEEPDEAGGCTNCGKCGKGRDERWREGYSQESMRDNYTPHLDAIRFHALASGQGVLGKRLLVLNNTVDQFSSVTELAEGNLIKRHDLE